MEGITYTFGLDCKIEALRGKTVTGGRFCRADGKCAGEPDAVRFAERINGQVLVVRISGRPDLEAALAAEKAAAKAVADRLAAIGWTQYQAAQRSAVNAQEAYDRASERGYPVREAQAMDQALAALDAAKAQYPLAAAYAKAQSFSFASHHDKASAGRAAMAAIEAGADPIAAIAAMDASWSAAAAKAVQNA